MRIAVATQEDPFYLPPALDALCRARSRDVVAIVILPAFNEGLLDTGRRLYEFYGPVDFLRLAGRFLLARVADRVNRARPLTRPYSAADVARRHGVPAYRPAKINAPEFVRVLREEIRPDLLVSIAASQILRRRVLEVPRLGCINLHSAPLPRYQGMMPNFWTMVHGEPEAAVTVHDMVEQLDAGDIIVQRPVPIRAGDSLHDLMVRSKEVGVEALLEAIAQLERGTACRRPMDPGQATYFSFPTRRDAERLRRMGRALL
jgi:methionyl-tRNA formyltransferase